MTTATGRRTAFEVRAIDPRVVGELLVRDDAGKAPRLLTDEEGGSPLRCCLRAIQPGERIALVSYAPLRRWARATGADPGPYDEVGPVFVHAGPCQGPDGTGYPGWLAGRSGVLRCYDAAGRILGGRLIEPDPGSNPAAAERVLADMFADPRVALVHRRALEFGCFTFEVRRTDD
ncbi:MAG: DUF1203 domain-containing protein [Actinobacteria bacterium]|nr:DUF1203 domain-containing protein [Actinomycetota bacterium]